MCLPGTSGDEVQACADEASPCVLERLCELHDGLVVEAKGIKQHYFRPYMHKLFRKQVHRATSLCCVPLCPLRCVLTSPAVHSVTFCPIMSTNGSSCVPMTLIQLQSRFSIHSIPWYYVALYSIAFHCICPLGVTVLMFSLSLTVCGLKRRVACWVGVSQWVLSWLLLAQDSSWLLEKKNRFLNHQYKIQ